MMHEEHERAEWTRAAAVMAMIHNCAFGVKHAVSPAELNPYAPRKTECVSSEFVAGLFGNRGKSRSGKDGNQDADKIKNDDRDRGDAEGCKKTECVEKVIEEPDDSADR